MDMTAREEDLGERAGRWPSPALLRVPPATGRGARTRAALVKAARTVFERSGYLDARLADITQEANCATGSFYTYFANKEEVFAAVLEGAQEDMMHPGGLHGHGIHRGVGKERRQLAEAVACRREALLGHVYRTVGVDYPSTRHYRVSMHIEPTNAVSNPFHHHHLHRLHVYGG